MALHRFADALWPCAWARLLHKRVESHVEIRGVTRVGPEPLKVIPGVSGTATTDQILDAVLNSRGAANWQTPPAPRHLKNTTRWVQVASLHWQALGGKFGAYGEPGDVRILEDKELASGQRLEWLLCRHACNGARKS